MKNLFESKISAVFAAIFCTLLWGTAFPFIKVGYEAFNISQGDIGSKLLFAGLRFFIAGLMTLAFLFASRRKFVLPAKTDLLPLFLLGGVQTFAQYLFTYIGIGFTGGASTSVITACASFFTVLFAAVFFKNDRLTALKILGCALGFGGVLVMNWGGFENDTLFGNAMILMSTLCAAGGNLIAKKFSPGRSPVLLTAYQLTFGGVCLTAAGLAAGGRLLFSLKSALILLWLAFVSAAAFTVWTALLKHHPASKISMFNLLVPIFGTLLSGVMLGEDVFRAAILVSLLLISAGIVTVNLSREDKKL